MESQGDRFPAYEPESSKPKLPAGSLSTEMKAKHAENYADRTAKSRQFLEGVYDRVSHKLQERLRQLVQESNEELLTLKRLADALEISTPSTDFSVDEEVVQKITWRPVARECVVILLRVVLEKATCEGIFLSKAQLDPMWSEAIALQEFADSTGLSQKDAKIALAISKNVLLEDGVFHQTVHLVMDRMTYAVHREDDGLFVQRLV